jgi:integrase
LPAAWKALHDALPTQHRQIALSSFMWFCSINAIAPDAVTLETLTNYEAWRLQRILGADASSKARAVASNWTWASANVPGWPAMPLKRLGMRNQYVLPLSAYPADLQADAELYLTRLGGAALDDIFPDDADVARASKVRRRKALSSRTIDTRRFQLRQAIVAMVLMGRDPASITGLRQLVDPPQQARAIISFYLAKAGNRRTSQTGGIAEVLRQIARYHCGLDDASVHAITTWARAAAPDQQTEMSEKNALRLQILLEPHNKARLLHLSDHLMDRAADPELPPRDAALLALYATALELLLAFPMRRNNLAMLRMDQQLQRIGPKSSLVTHIRLTSPEMKNSQPMLWPLGDHSGRLLETYLRVYRPTLAAAGNPYLFPNTKMGHRAGHDLGVGLSELIEREIGCEFNMHILRGFAVACHLQRHPGQYETARRMLGHKSVTTTTNHYAGLEADAAARSVDAGLIHDRSTTRMAANAAFGSTRKRSGAARKAAPSKPLKRGG